MIENVSANGGKMTDANKATLTSMIAGQEGMAAWLSVLMASEADWQNLIDKIDAAHGRAEAMANTKMDTLEGDVKTLGSAFEALQLEIFEGDAGNGLRAFTQGLTDDIRFLQNLLKDGFDIGDIGGMLAKVATQLKDKFLAFDGVGSILAGGALVMGLKKIYDLTMRLKAAAIATRSWWQGAAATMNGGVNPNTRGSTVIPPTTGGVVQSVGTMHVNAGVVNISGKVAGGTSGNTRNGTVTGGGTAGTNTRGGTVTTGGVAGSRTNIPPSIPSNTSVVSRFAGIGSAAAGAGLFTAIFAAMDAYSTRSTNESTINEAQATYKKAEEEYNHFKEIYDAIAKENDPERTNDLAQAQIQMDTAAQDLQQASANLKAVQREAVKHNNESLFGGAGAVTGAAAGAAVGSIVPFAGTAVGAVVGLVLSMVGAAIGSEIGKEAGKNFDYDVLGWIKGENGKQSRIEEAVAKADWMTDSGKKFSELSDVERIELLRNGLSDDERTRRDEAQTAARSAAVREEYGEASMSDFRKIDEASTKEYLKQNEFREKQKYTDYTKPAAFNPNQPFAATMYGDENSRQITQLTGNPIGKPIFEYLKSVFGNIESAKADAMSPTDYTSQFLKESLKNSGVSAEAQRRADANTNNSVNVAGLLDNLLFNKAAANPIHAENEPQRNSITAGLEAVQALVQSQQQLAASSQNYNSQVQTQIQNQQQLGESFKGISLGLEVAQNLAQSQQQLAASSQNYNAQAQVQIQSQQQLGDSFKCLATGLEAVKSIVQNQQTNQVQPESASVDTPDYGAKIAEQLGSIEIPELGIKEKFAAELEGVNELFTAFGENLTSTFTNFEMPELGIGEKFTTEFEGAGELFTSFGESITTTFSGLASGIQGSLSGVGTAITSVFSSAASEVQGQWGAMPGFFSGIFGGLGGAAASAGAAIAAGLTSGIGTVISAWSSAAAQISSIISSISAQAASASSIAVPSVGANATGTSSWQGGFTEINEHGGEIIDLPQGTRIYPHATTLKLLQRDIEEGKLIMLFQT